MSRYQPLDPDLKQQYNEERRLLDSIRRATLEQRDMAAYNAAMVEHNGLDRKFRQLQAERGPRPPTALELENRMTLEQRIDRIEQHLQLGRYHKDF